MPIRTLLRRIGRAIFWIGVVLSALNIETLATAFGYNTVLQTLVASQRAWIARAASIVISDTAFHFALIAIGVGLAAYVDRLAKAFEQKRVKRSWWAGLHSFTIRDFSCLVADIPPGEFENSARAKAIAGEIRGYVNSGHMPTMLEQRVPAMRIQDYGGPEYAAKSVGNDAQVLRGDLERLAIARKWQLPWEPQERKRPVTSPSAVPALRLPRDRPQ